MAAILLERMDKQLLISKIVDWWRKVQIPRALVMQWRVLGKDLAAKCEEAPMLLVEKIWKGNELVHPSLVPPDDRAWAADALGWLGERRAVFPLISMLTEAPANAPRNLCVSNAATALGRLGDSRAAAAVCHASAIYSGSPPANQCLEAVDRCADQRSVALIEACAMNLQEGRIRSALLKIAKEARTRPTTKIPAKERPD
jgi:hypothetical protein